MSTWRTSVSLDVVEDAGIIRLLTEAQSRGEGSQLIRAALYAYSEQPSRRELLDAIRALEQEMRELSYRLIDMPVEASAGPADGEAERNLLDQVDVWRGG